jgi:hypothetical protein
MNVVCGDFSPYKGVAGRLRNIQSSLQQTAPIPYTSRANTAWDTDNTWTHSSVWDVPNSTGINGDPIDWNIVKTDHNISTNTRDLIVLGLLVDSNKLTVTDLTDTQDETNQGVGLWVTDYLKLNGEIDLVGESQLVQKRYYVGNVTNQFNESILDVSSAGNLERDQQGTTNLFNYNYFSSPVSQINTGANNVPENLVNLLLDGTNTNANPHPVIAWTGEYNAAGTNNPITLSNRWIFQYENYPTDTYAAWSYKGNTGSLTPGYGFTMKGSGVGNIDEGDNITGGGQANGTQNYVFKGKPNNETINIPITSYYQALVGNPYPSAIDSNELIRDNIPGGNSNTTSSIDGSLYLWEHYESNQTHILSEYQGAYAVLNLIGGVNTYNPGLISGAGTSSKTPGRYIPVGQGFFVANVFPSGGTVKFENDQRLFFREQSNPSFDDTSVFLRNSTKKQNSKVSNLRNTTVNNEISRLRLTFTSHIDGKIRPLLLGFTPDNSATEGLDYGYDAPNQYFQNNDAFFIIEDGVYVIQGVGAFDDSKKYPLGVYLSENSDVEVALVDLENFDSEIDVFIYDAILDTYTKLNDTNFEFTDLAADYYADRFYVTFKDNSVVIDEEVLDESNGVKINYLTNTDEIFINAGAKGALVSEVQLINVLGQVIKKWDEALEQYHTNAYRIPVKGIQTSPYVLKVQIDGVWHNKKIIIKN